MYVHPLLYSFLTASFVTKKINNKYQNKINTKNKAIDFYNSVCQL